MLIDQNVYHSIAMILALIVTAIIWNLGTWYFGLPCSSSHTLIGSIFGVGIAYSFLPEAANVALNWAKVKDVGLSLMISPLIGFALALGLMFFLKRIVKDKSIFKEPDTDNPPPFYMRAILILTCTSVSFSHGSNDGQKGVGLIMIILIGIIPIQFAINRADSPMKMIQQTNKIELALSNVDSSKFNDDARFNFSQIKKNLDTIQATIGAKTTFDSLKSGQLVLVRKSILTAAKKYEALIETPGILSKDSKSEIKSEFKGLKSYTEYAPWWVILMISLSLGIGTMIGWKRIVVTLGEKIGKTHLSYAQGASAEIVAASTIGISTLLGLPVSTTHVLTSGIAGTMVAKKKKNLRMKTVRNIAIAWVVTIPVTILLSGGLFLLFRLILK
jgi:phosphate/sulfate permease